jgi:hypothetical protein
MITIITGTTEYLKIDVNSLPTFYSIFLTILRTNVNWKLNQVTQTFCNTVLLIHYSMGSAGIVANLFCGCVIVFHGRGILFPSLGTLSGKILFCRLRTIFLGHWITLPESHKIACFALKLSLWRILLLNLTIRPSQLMFFYVHYLHLQSSECKLWTPS